MSYKTSYSVKWEENFVWLTAVNQINIVRIAYFVAKILKLMEVEHPR